MPDYRPFCFSRAIRELSCLRLLLLKLLCFGMLTVSSPSWGSGELGIDVYDANLIRTGWEWLAPHARVTADETDYRNDPAQVLSIAPNAWERPSEAVFTFEFGTPTRWIHIPLHNRSNQAVTRTLEVVEPLYDDMQIWTLQEGNVQTSVHMGDRVPFASRPIPYRNPCMQVTIPSNATIDLLIRAEAHDGEHDPLPIRLWDNNAFQAGTSLDTLAYGAYFGAILILLLYNLLIFISTRESGFFWYAVYLASFFAWNFSFRGFGYQYIWPTSPDLNSNIGAVLVACTLIAASKFAYVLLDLRQQTPWLYRLSLGLALVALLHIPVALIAPESGLFATLNPTGFLIISVLMAAALRLAWRGNVTARIYLAAMGCLYAGTLPYYFVAFGIMPQSLLTIHAMNIGSALELLLLAFALAYRINTLKTEKLEAEQMALATLQSSANELENKVRERTSELEEAIGSLHELAIRDILTGLYNRRHFNETVPRELARAHRLGKPLALLILDLDHFKKLNDCAGHQAGDEVLKNLGNLLQAFCRRSVDQAFRIGGEEFAVVTTDTASEGLAAWAEQLRLRIEDAAWPHPDTPSGKVSASIGITVSRPDDTFATLYARADITLYKAKEAGRNQVAAEDFL